MMMFHEMLAVLDQQYRITIRNDSGASPDIHILEESLASLAEHMQSPHQRVTGSLWVKRYCSLFAGALYAFSHSDYALDVTMSHVRVTMNGKGLLQFELLHADEPVLSDATLSRERKRELYYQKVVNEHMRPLFQEVNRLTGIDEATLWSTLSYLLAYWVPRWQEETSSTLLRERIREDYEFLTESVESITSHFRSVASPLPQEEPILIRNKCCLNYCLPGEDRYCYTCPRITDERRMDKYLVAHGIQPTISIAK